MFSYLRKHNSILKNEIQDVSHNISFTTFLYVFIYKKEVRKKSIIILYKSIRRLTQDINIQKTNRVNHKL